jgi:hypothetical protein
LKRRILLSSFGIAHTTAEIITDKARHHFEQYFKLMDHRIVKSDLSKVLKPT